MSTGNSTSGNQDKQKFGNMDDSNPNWTALVAEMTTYRQNHMQEEWPGPQSYADKVNANWKKFNTSQFYYRFQEASKKIDRKLDRE